jgi:hypothetical protein
VAAKFAGIFCGFTFTGSASMPFAFTSSPMLPMEGEPVLTPEPFGGYPESDTPCCMLYRDPSVLVPQPVQIAAPTHNASAAQILVLVQLTIRSSMQLRRVECKVQSRKLP